MTCKLASLFAIATFCAGSLAFAEVHGGAIPNNFSFYEAAEFTDIQWMAGRDAAPVWGSIVLEGTNGLRFLPDNGVEVKVSYTDIKSIKYDRVVKEKEKTGNQKWFQRPFGFAKGVETYRVVTIQHRSGDVLSTSSMRVDTLNSTGILRMLEIKTGLRTKRLSGL